MAQQNGKVMVQPARPVDTGFIQAGLVAKVARHDDK